MDVDYANRFVVNSNKQLSDAFACVVHDIEGFSREDVTMQFEDVTYQMFYE